MVLHQVPTKQLFKAWTTDRVQFGEHYTITYYGEVSKYLMTRQKAMEYLNPDPKKRSTVHRVPPGHPAYGIEFGNFKPNPFYSSGNPV
jgi:hypothetical protein